MLTYPYPLNTIPHIAVYPCHGILTFIAVLVISPWIKVAYNTECDYSRLAKGCYTQDCCGRVHFQEVGLEVPSTPVPKFQ